MFNIFSLLFSENLIFPILFYRYFDIDTPFSPFRQFRTLGQMVNNQICPYSCFRFSFMRRFDLEIFL